MDGMLLIGSRDGVYRSSTDGNNLSLILDEVEVYDLTSTADAFYVAAVEGLFRSVDGGEKWERLPVPTVPVSAVVASPDETQLYAGTMPARMYTSDDGGDSWRELAGLQRVPSRDRWYNRDVPVHVRSLGVTPAAPERVIAGIDGGGVHVSNDRGETWAERLSGVPQYVHDVVVSGPTEYVAATDAGLFRTSDGGQWWDFLHDDDLKHRYFRGAARRGEMMYAGGARTHPPTWWKEGGADAALYHIDFSVDERKPRIVPISYPGEPDELVLGGSTTGDGIVMGTTRGQLLTVVDTDEVETLTALPVDSEIRGLSVV